MMAQWFGLGTDRDASAVFEAAGSGVVGIAKHGDGHHLLGTAASREEAVVIATSLRLNPN